ncbi:MAG: hypothetical protein NZM25_08725 [Leptospiraceae bacterium]|nr:hypothetical protein [Leptospiraceae bacterium]
MQKNRWITHSHGLVKKGFVLIIALALIILSCVSHVEESEEIKVYPNPYRPTAGFLTIKDKNGNSLGNHVELIVYTQNYEEVYRGRLQNDKYAGIDNQGEPLRSGLYMLKIIQIEHGQEKIMSYAYRLVVE